MMFGNFMKISLGNGPGHCQLQTDCSNGTSIFRLLLVVFLVFCGTLITYRENDNLKLNCVVSLAGDTYP